MFNNGFQWIILFIGISILSSWLPIANGQYPLEEPMAEPQPEPPDQEMTNAAYDVIDLMTKGKYAEVMTSSTNFTGYNQSIIHKNYFNISFPLYGKQREFVVDGTIKEYSTPTTKCLAISNVTSFVFSNVSSRRKAAEINLVVISEMHSKNFDAIDGAEICCPNTYVTENDYKPLVEVKYYNIIPGKAGAVSVHSVDVLKNTSHPNGQVSTVVQPFAGSVEYTVDLAKRYIPVMKAIKSQSGSIQGWLWQCGRWEINASKWNTENCFVVNATGSSMTCYCNKSNDLTLSSTYTLLLSVGRDTGLTNDLLLLCVSFETISLVSLFIALIILLGLRNSIRSLKDHNRLNTTTIHINLCLALLSVHLLVLIRPLCLGYDLPCRAVAVLTHYFLLVSGAWMFVEGLTLYRSTCGKSFSYGSAERPWLHTFLCNIFAWVSPMVVVALSAGIGMSFGEYMDYSKEYKLMTLLQRIMKPQLSELAKAENLSYPKYSTCWLSSEMTYAAAVPITLMLIPNVIIAIVVCIRIWRIKRLEHKNNSRFKQPPTVSKRVGSDDSIKTAKSSKTPLIASLRAFLILLPVLGVPWIGTFVGVVPAAETTVTALHVLASSMQGVMVAIIVCFINRDVRRILKRRLCVKLGCLTQNRVAFATSTTK